MQNTGFLMTRLSHDSDSGARWPSGRASEVEGSVERGGLVVEPLTPEREVRGSVERGGLVVEPRNPEREVEGSIPTSTVLSP